MSFGCRPSASWVTVLLAGLALAGASASRPAVARDDAPEVRVAVAANFKQTLEKICDAFRRLSAARCVVIPGASGLLYAKIIQGAPFDVFLSADTARALRLEAEGRAVPGTRVTYALGRLAFWRPGAPLRGDLRAALSDGQVKTIAIANPELAPYGEAAFGVLRALGLGDGGRFEFVRGESIAQAFQFVATGAADAGFVALSQVLEYETATGRDLRSEVIVVDAALHAPLEQQAVLLDTARDPRVAREFVEFLRSADARRLILAGGYAAPPVEPM